MGVKRHKAERPGNVVPMPVKKKPTHTLTHDAIIVGDYKIWRGPDDEVFIEIFDGEMLQTTTGKLEKVIKKFFVEEF